MSTYTELSPVERKTAAQSFAEQWAGQGYEKGDTHKFWLQLLTDVVGMADTTTEVHFEQRTEAKGISCLSAKRPPLR